MHFGLSACPKATTPQSHRTPLRIPALLTIGRFEDQTIRNIFFSPRNEIEIRDSFATQPVQISVDRSTSSRTEAKHMLAASFDEFEHFDQAQLFGRASIRES
jgi:hypothetical protein